MSKASSLVWLARIQVGIAVILAGLCAYHVYATGVINTQQRMLNVFSQNQRTLEALAGATFEFASTNRAFDAALIQAGIKVRTNPAPATTHPNKR